MKSTSVIKVATMYEKYRRFLVMQRKPSNATTKLMLFIVSKDECNTKEDITSWAEATLNIEKTQPIALAFTKLR